MGVYKNIIYITGNDSYGQELELTRWLSTFQSKYGSINIDRYDLGDTQSLKSLPDLLLSGGLFAEKRLFILRGGRDRKSKQPGLEEMLDALAPQIPADHFLIFHHLSDTESTLQTWLRSHADVRSIDTLWDRASWQRRYDVSDAALSDVMRYYTSTENLRERGSSNPHLGHEIAHSLEMVSLLEASGAKLTQEDRLSYCHGYAGDTLYTLTDAILAGDAKKALRVLDRIKVTLSIEEWYASLIGLLRNSVYILALKLSGVAPASIGTHISAHSFVIQKTLGAKISYLRLRDFYHELIDANIAYKRGKGLRDNELGRILSIELALIGLQNSGNS